MGMYNDYNEFNNQEEIMSASNSDKADKKPIDSATIFFFLCPVLPFFVALFFTTFQMGHEKALHDAAERKAKGASYQVGISEDKTKNNKGVEIASHHD